MDWLSLDWLGKSTRVAYPKLALCLLKWGDIRGCNLLPGQLVLIAWQQSLSILKGRLQLVGILQSKAQWAEVFRVEVNFTSVTRMLAHMKKGLMPGRHTCLERAGAAAQPWQTSCWRCPPCCWAGARWHSLGWTPKSSLLPALWTSSRVPSYSRWRQCPNGGETGRV